MSIRTDDIRELVAAAGGEKAEEVKVLRSGFTRRGTGCARWQRQGEWRPKAGYAPVGPGPALS